MSHDTSPSLSLSELIAILRPEHDLLNAAYSYSEELEVELPASYGEDEEGATAFEGAALADLSGMTALLITGAPATSFVEMACAGRRLAVGEVAFSAVLAGDGSLVSIPLLARTGDEEYLLWDLSPRAAVLQAWTAFLSNIEQGGVAPFEGLEINDVSTHLLPLLLAGSHATDILQDYHADELPAAGHVASLSLDRMSALVVGLPEEFASGFLVFISPQTARVLWRSLLSFSLVVPVGWQTLQLWAQRCVDWYPLVRDTARVVPRMDALRTWQLIRDDERFVGARSLAHTPETSHDTHDKEFT
jgi:aminomethyltransferase